MAKERGVSVVVPVQNAERWIPAAVKNLKSVLGSALDQSASEVLFVENGSTDLTRVVLEKEVGGDDRFRVLVSAPGIVPALNLGLEAARNEWIMRHDADDLSRPDRIERFFSFLDARSGEDFSMVCSHSIVASADDQVLARMRVGPGTGFVHGSAFLNKKRVLEVGGYSNRLPHAEDQDLWARLAERPHHRMGYIGEYLYWFRSHGQSVSASQLQTQLAAFPDEKGGIWTPRVRAAVARLAWDHNRIGALRVALSNAHFRKPERQDVAVPARIFAGNQLDRFRARRVWKEDPGLKAFTQFLKGP